jgi:hypothetical protein
MLLYLGAVPTIDLNSVYNLLRIASRLLLMRVSY